MRTTRFEPTPAWKHAMTQPDCPYHLLLVACDGEQAIGWCRVFPLGHNGTAELGVGLLAPYRNRGLGTRMVREAIRWARQAGLSNLILTTREDNQRAIHVFRKCGFEATGVEEPGWLVMELPFAWSVL